MRRFAWFGLALLALPSIAFAHVSVRPRESKADAEERYTVRVPTEGAVATTHVQLEIPAGLTVLEVLSQDGATFDTAKQGDRITAITWRKEIPPKAAAEFVFRARNPESGDLVWRAHQHFSDGTVADWVGQTGERRPAAVTKLTAAGRFGSIGSQARGSPMNAEENECSGLSGQEADDEHFFLVQNPLLSTWTAFHSGRPVASRSINPRSPFRISRASTNSEEPADTCAPVIFSTSPFLRAQPRVSIPSCGVGEFSKMLTDPFSRLRRSPSR